MNKRTNTYYLSRAEIKRLSERYSLSAVDATDYFRAANELHDEKEYMDWVTEVRKYEQSTKHTLADLFK